MLTKLLSLYGWLPPILMLGALVFLHELGHFLVAKWMGMSVDVFSLGFGKRLVGFRFRETDVRLSALPLGGYVRLKGSEGDEDGEEELGKHPVWKRMMFFAGGVIANLLVAFVVLSAIGADLARVTSAHPPKGPLKVATVAPKSPADVAGLNRGDRILSVGDMSFKDRLWTDLVSYLAAHPTEKLVVTYERDAKVVTTELTPVQGEDGKPRIGVAPSRFDVVMERRSLRPMDLVKGVQSGALEIEKGAKMIFTAVGQLLTFRAKMDQVGGPIAIVQQSREAAEAGWIHFLYLAGLISLQLAIFNLVPLPALDGGHMVVTLFETARGRALSQVSRVRWTMAGFFMVGGLMTAVVALDLVRLAERVIYSMRRT